MDRGAWQATVQGVTKSWTQLSTHTSPHLYVSCIPQLWEISKSGFRFLYWPWEFIPFSGLSATMLKMMGLEKIISRGPPALPSKKLVCSLYAETVGGATHRSAPPQLVTQGTTESSTLLGSHSLSEP